jgi:hypothetical protein
LPIESLPAVARETVHALGLPDARVEVVVLDDPDEGPEGAVLVRVTLAGRSGPGDPAALDRALVDALGTRAGVRPEDVLVTVVDVREPAQA